MKQDKSPEVKRLNAMECLMKYFQLSIGLICALICGQAAGAVWTNEPTGTQVLDCPFNSLGACGITGGGPAIVSDASAPVSPSNVAKSWISAGTNLGGSEIHYVLPQTSNQLYVGIMWRTNSQFEGRPQGNKLFFVRGPNTNGVFLFNSGALMNGQGRLIWGHNTTGLNNSHACGGDAYGALCFPNIGSGALTTGVWTKLEAYIKASATATSRDGIVRWWVNGVLAGNYANLNYPGPLNEWMWAETWDNTPNFVVSTEWDHFLDHLHISAPNCPAPGCAAPAYLVITSSIGSARVGTPFTVTLAGEGGTKPYTWFKESGNLPAGLSLSTNGVLSGTPTCAGRSDFTVRVTDGSQPALTATRSYTIVTSGTSTSCPSSNATGPGPKTKQAQFFVKADGAKVVFNLPVTGSARYTLNVYDPSGKKVYERVSLAQREISITKTLKNGVYLARFVQGVQSSAFRFSVMN